MVGSKLGLSWGKNRVPYPVLKEIKCGSDFDYDSVLTKMD
jgi:hypothetical protein